MEADVLLVISLVIIHTHSLILNGDTANNNQRQRYECSTPSVQGQFCYQIEIQTVNNALLIILTFISVGFMTS